MSGIVRPQGRKQYKFEYTGGGKSVQFIDILGDCLHIYNRFCDTYDKVSMYAS